MSGFDTPGRALLRTYVEALLLCIAVVHDPTLARAYLAAEDDAQIKTFWHTSASPKNLHERIVAVERKLGFDDGLVRSLTAWRREEYEILSQSSHLSYAAATLTAMTRVLGSEDYAPGFLGRESAHSLRTISYAAATTWYFSRMTVGKLFGIDQCLIVLDRENELHQRIFAGRETFNGITHDHWPNFKDEPNDNEEIIETT